MARVISPIIKKMKPALRDKCIENLSEIFFKIAIGEEKGYEEPSSLIGFTIYPFSDMIIRIDGLYSHFFHKEEEKAYAINDRMMKKAHKIAAGKFKEFARDD